MNQLKDDLEELKDIKKELLKFNERIDYIEKRILETEKLLKGEKNEEESKIDEESF